MGDIALWKKCGQNVPPYTIKIALSQTLHLFRIHTSEKIAKIELWTTFDFWRLALTLDKTLILGEYSF